MTARGFEPIPWVLSRWSSHWGWNAGAFLQFGPASAGLESVWVGFLDLEYGEGGMLQPLLSDGYGSVLRLGA